MDDNGFSEVSLQNRFSEDKQPLINEAWKIVDGKMISQCFGGLVLTPKPQVQFFLDITNCAKKFLIVKKSNQT